MNLSSNIFPIVLEFDEFQIQRINWEEGKLDSLRERYNQSYSFFRSGDFVYISPGQDNLEQLGDLTTVKVSDNPEIVSSLLRHIFFRAFKGRYPDIKPTFYPFTFPSRKEEHNLILEFLPINLKNAISYKKLNEIYIKWGELNNQKCFFLVIDSSYKWALRYNCATLKKQNFDISNLEVAKLVKYGSSNEVAAPTFQAIGRVLSISGDKAEVETNTGKEEFDLQTLFLNKTHENIKLFLEHSVGTDEANSILQKVKKKEFERNDPTITNKEIIELINVLNRFEYGNFDGFCFTIGNRAVIDFPQLQLENPKYLFDVSFSKVDTSPSRGLNTFGPYDHGKFFEINKPKVLVVCHKNSSGAFSQFLGKLKDGIPDSNYFSKGFLAKYRLQNIQFHYVEIEDYFKNTYLQAIKNAINSSSLEFDIAIVETREDFKKMLPEENPYWAVKAYLLQKGITVQYIKQQNARNPEFIIDSCALQMYAKLGGTPWVLPASPNIAHELIIGIGSSFVKTNNFSGATQNRVIGITTFFNSDGRYLLSNKSKEVSYNEYFEELLSNLKDSINRISLEQGWTEKEIVRIVFHVFKPMKNLEVDVVAQLINEYPDYDIKFAFLSFGEHHPYMIFDLDQNGVSNRYGNIVKGKLVPQRGTNFLLEHGICLLQLKGPKDIKTDRQGFTPPLLIKIHPKSTFTDTTYLVQQVFRLTNISYRSFTPSQLPVTLFYASLITDQLNNLSHVNGWNTDFIRQLRNRKWFI